MPPPAQQPAPPPPPPLQQAGPLPPPPLQVKNSALQLETTHTDIPQHMEVFCMNFHGYLLLPWSRLLATGQISHTSQSAYGAQGHSYKIGVFQIATTIWFYQHE